MTSKIDICNRALSMIGTRSTIASLTEISNEANLCNIHYDNTRASVLRLHNWSFARRRVALPLLAAANGTPENPSGTSPLPETPWSYKYAHPVDCLRVRSIYQPSTGGTPIEFLISSDVDTAGNQIKVIFCNQQAAELIYTTDISGPDLWDQNFTDALVASLASDLAIPLTGDKTVAQYCVAQANSAILLARVTDSTESPANTEHVPDWVAVRGFSTSTSADLGLINSVLS